MTALSALLPPDVFSPAEVEALAAGQLGPILLRLCQPPAAPALQASTAGELAALRAALLEQQRQLAALKREAAQLGGRAVVCNAYSSRLQQLHEVLRQYGQELELLLVRFGLGAEREVAGYSNPAPLKEHIQDREAALRRALQASPADAGALLQQSFATCPIELTAATVLPLVQAGLAEDTAAVSSLQQWGGSEQPQPVLHSILDTLRERHAVAFAAAQLAKQQQNELLEPLQQARRAAAAVVRAEDSSDGSSAEQQQPASTRLAQLAARRAGLQAALQRLEGLHADVESQEAAAAAQQEAAVTAQATLEGLQQQEEELDRGLKLLCAADGAFMRQWREATWQAQGLIADGLLAQRQPLQQLGNRLADVMQQDLMAFKGVTWPEAAAPSAACSSDVTASSAEQAVLRLDPVADLKTSENSTAVLLAAAEELQQLRRVHAAWEALVSGGQERAQQLQARAEELQQGVTELEGPIAQGIQEQLENACTAASEGMAAVQSVRSALADWWTLPALKAAPWLKREGRTAAEWLQLIAEQQEQLLERDSLLKDNNKKR